MGATSIFILTVVVSVSTAVVYDPHLNVIRGNYDTSNYNDGAYVYGGNDGIQNDLNKVDREKVLAIVSTLLQQDRNAYNPYSPFLFTFKGNRKGLVSWRKWIGWNKSQANSAKGNK